MVRFLVRFQKTVINLMRQMLIQRQMEYMLWQRLDFLKRPNNQLPCKYLLWLTGKYWNNEYFILSVQWCFLVVNMLFNTQYHTHGSLILRPKFTKWPWTLFLIGSVNNGFYSYRSYKTNGPNRVPQISLHDQMVSFKTK